LPDVFVSYSRADRAVARSFAESFEREGFSVWWDQAINPGEAFDQVTEQALEDAKAVIVLWSRASVNSRWVRAEATQANANNRLLPVMIEPCRRPIIFELTHTVDLSEWAGNADDPTWQSLVASVRRQVERTTSADSAATATTPPAGSAATRPAAEAAGVERAFPARPAARDREGIPRRKALLYGASALGLAAAGFAGGVLLRGSGGSSPVLPPSFHRLTFRRGLIRSARFAPDGKTILFGALWDGAPCRAHSTRIDNPESRALDLPDANVLAVSRSGDLALAIGPNLDGVFTYGTLARVPMAGGAPRELIERVKFADWTPDGSELAIVRNVDGVDQLEYPLGKVQFRPQAAEGTGLGFARISPDGQQVAFIHYQDPQSLIGRVCLADRSGKITVLSGTSVNIHGLAWRGSEILYSASEDRPLFRSLQAVKPGGAPRIVARMPVNVTLWDVAADGSVLIAQTDDRAVMIGRLPGEAHERDLSWLDASGVADLSTDGGTVLFSETGQGVGAVPAAYLRGTDGSPAVRLGNGHPLALAPDRGSAVIVQVDQSLTGSGRFIDIVPTGAGESRRLPNEGFAYSSARWLRDGQGLIVCASVQGRPERLYRVELRDGRHEPVTPERIGSWALSPDGLTIAATGPEPAILLYPARGGAARAVPRTTGTESLLGWVDEGLLVTRLDNSPGPRGEVHLLDPVTGRNRFWANILPRDDVGIMLMVSFAATPDGRACVFTWHRALSNLYIAHGLT
jgi:hypothetical protein